MWSGHVYVRFTKYTQGPGYFDQFVFVYRNLRLPYTSKLCTLFLGARTI